MKLKKLSFASITLTAALFFSYVIPETVFTNESIAQAAIVNQKQVTFEIKPYPGTELDKFYLDTINGYVLKPATIYEENGQKYVNINVLGVGNNNIITKLQAIIADNNYVDAIITNNANNIHTAKFPLTKNNILDIRAETVIGEVKLQLEFASLPIDMNSVTVTNNYGKADVITIKNATVGAIYKIYDSNKKFLKQFTAKNKTENFSISQLGGKAGAIYISIQDSGFKESTLTKVTFGAEQQAKAFAAKNVTITNNKGAKDKFVLKGLTKGYTYTIYSDKALKKKFYSFTSDGTTKTFTKQLPTAKSGILYIVATKSGLKPSSVTQVKYNGEPTPALAAKNVKITNKKKGIDTIKLTGLKKGTTYIIYKDAKKKTKLATIKATKSTHSVKVNLNTKGGKVYITAQSSGYSVSPTTTVSYKKAK